MDARKIEKAKELRKTKTLTETARAMGVSKATIIRWTVPGALERDREASRNWKANHPDARAVHEHDAQGTCASCGGPTSRRGHKKCQSCSRGEWTAQGEQRRVEVARRWRAGESAREIAAALKTTTGTICVIVSRLRSAGEDMPYSRDRRLHGQHLA